jgi:hypothetical protein
MGGVQGVAVIVVGLHGMTPEDIPWTAPVNFGGADASA